jgi:hypothetical protein
VLRATHRLLRPGGRLVCTTIHVAPGLTPAQRRKALSAGPPAVSGPDVGDLLARADFSDIRAEDVTAEFLDTARSWLAARLRHRDALSELNAAAYADRVATCRSEIGALEAGLVRRTRYLATR